MRKHLVLPVIHHCDAATSLEQAELALTAGADGVFLIAHDGRDSALFEPARQIKLRHPDLLVGLNLLRAPAAEAYQRVAREGLDMVWADAPGVSSRGLSEDGRQLCERMRMHSAKGEGPRVFGAVAFKYQPSDDSPALAAKLAAEADLLPTTSGSATGSPPALAKAEAMSRALNGGELAVASGMTPENVAAYLPYFTHYLVATGVSRDMHHFDPVRLASFIERVRAGVTAPAVSP